MVQYVFSLSFVVSIMSTIRVIETNNAEVINHIAHSIIVGHVDVTWSLILEMSA